MPGCGGGQRRWGGNGAGFVTAAPALGQPDVVVVVVMERLASGRGKTGVTGNVGTSGSGGSTSGLGNGGNGTGGLNNESSGFGGAGGKAGIGASGDRELCLAESWGGAESLQSIRLVTVAFPGIRVIQVAMEPPVTPADSGCPVKNVLATPVGCRAEPVVVVAALAAAVVAVAVVRAEAAAAAAAVELG